MSTPSDRQRRFEELVALRVAGLGGWKISHAFGVSNSAKVIEGGLQLAVLNMAAVNSDIPSWLLMSLVRFAPADEVLFGLVVGPEGLASARDRIDAMMLAGAGDRNTLLAGDDLQYSARANNVSVYLHQSARLYLRNRGFWDSLPEDLTPYGPAVPVDRAFVQVHHGESRPPAVGAVEFVRHLQRLLGSVELEAVGDAAVAATPVDSLPSVQVVRQRFEADGGIDRDGALERLHLALAAMRPRGIAVLEGLDGVAAADLVRRYARALSGRSSTPRVTALPNGASLATIEAFDHAHAVVLVDLDAETTNQRSLLAEATRRSACADEDGICWPLVVGIRRDPEPEVVAHEVPVVRARPTPLEGWLDALGLEPEERAYCRAVFGSDSQPPLLAVQRALLDRSGRGGTQSR